MQIPRNRPWLAIIAGILASSLLSTGAIAEIYKWKDENGEVHYSQTPPPSGVKADTIEGAPPPADNPEQIRQRLQDQLNAYDDERAVRDEDHAQRKKHKEALEIIRKNCKTARSNLASLQQGGQKRFMTAEGEVKHLTDEERTRRIEEAEGQIKEFCKD